MNKTNERSTVIKRPLEHISIRPSRQRIVRMVQNFLLVWLNTNIDEKNSDNYRNTIIKLRQVVNAIYTFVKVDECINFITDIKEEKVFLIVSGALEETTVSMTHNLPQLTEVYILGDGEKKAWHEHWARCSAKFHGVFTDITTICDALRRAVQNHDHNSISISFVRQNDRINNQNLDQLDQSFMYTQILKEILLTIDFEQKHINEFLTYCREQFSNNTVELRNIDKFEHEYYQHSPIWWYTYPCFLYSMLNRALRAMEVDLVIKMGFFIRDLHNHIAKLYTEQYDKRDHPDSFTVYRGQSLSKQDFEQMMITQHGLMSFNSFTSTSRIRAVSLAFSESYPNTSDLIGVLFEIKIDPSISSFPFVNVKNVSNYQAEEEILFSMHSVFRIGQIKQIENNSRLWQVNLTSTGDKDPELHALTEYIRGETFSRYSGWDRLGQLLLKMGESSKAEQVYEMMLEQTTNESETGSIYNQLGRTRYDQGEYKQAITFYEKALQIHRKTLPLNHSLLSTTYNNIATVYQNMGEYSKALSYYEKALEVYQKSLPPNHPDLATSYNNIGAVYQNMGEYLKALSLYEKGLEIYQKTLPPNHPDLSVSYNNIGLVYDKMGEYPKALSYYEKALEIRQKTLPANHPDLATSYNNMGGVYDHMGEYSKALSYLEKALEIKQKSLPPNHPNLASSYSNIGLLYHKMGEYSKALPFLERAIGIFQKTLPSDHPNLAISYNNIALVYDNMGEYSNALSFHKKALEIRQKTLPSNHPDLAISHNNIGLVYDKLDDCPTALFYHEKALKIYQQTLPANHPHLGAVYNNMGEVYFKMEDYSKALSYYERALSILQRSLPSNHPHIRTLKENIDEVKKKL